jgi:O-antigen ligase
MAELISDIFKRWIMSTLLGVVSMGIMGSSLDIGDNLNHRILVFTVLFYSLLILFIPSQHRLFHILSIPLISQFLHIFQKYSFPAGANSIWRLLPFLFLFIFFVHHFLHHPLDVNKNRKLLLISWVCFSILFLVISPHLPYIIAGGILLYILILPGYFLYLHQASSRHFFIADLERYLCLLFMVFALGTFGLIYLASSYQGSDNLLVTRNIADTNITMAYFILLWPFALNYSNNPKVPVLIQIIILFQFASLVYFSFSRGAFMLIIPYLLLTLYFQHRKGTVYWMVILGTIAYLYRTRLQETEMHHSMTYFWSLRFSDTLVQSDFWNRIQQQSGRVDIQQIAYTLFLDSPILGNGIGSFEMLGPGFREAHSMYYTLLAEVGALGSIYFYALFLLLWWHLFRNKIMLIALLFFLLFNHTVGMVFIIIPAKSISINCFAPMLLLCMYFYRNAQKDNPI